MFKVLFFQVTLEEGRWRTGVRDHSDLNGQTPKTNSIYNHPNVLNSIQLFHLRVAEIQVSCLISFIIFDPVRDIAQGTGSVAILYVELHFLPLRGVLCTYWEIKRDGKANTTVHCLHICYVYIDSLTLCGRLSQAVSVFTHMYWSKRYRAVILQRTQKPPLIILLAKRDLLKSNQCSNLLTL